MNPNRKSIKAWFLQLFLYSDCCQSCFLKGLGARRSITVDSKDKPSKKECLILRCYKELGLKCQMPPLHSGSSTEDRTYKERKIPKSNRDRFCSEFWMGKLCSFKWQAEWRRWVWLNWMAISCSWWKIKSSTGAVLRGIPANLLWKPWDHCGSNIDPR